MVSEGYNPLWPVPSLLHSLLSSLLMPLPCLLHSWFHFVCWWTFATSGSGCFPLNLFVVFGSLFQKIHWFGCYSVSVWYAPFLYLHYNIWLLYSTCFFMPSLWHGGPFSQPLLQHLAPSLYRLFATFHCASFALSFLQHLTPSLAGCLHYSQLA